jgi:hypothetical protein
MAYTLEVGSVTKVSLCDYKEYIEKNVNFKDVGSVIESAPMLKALSEDENLLLKHLNSYLKNPSASEIGNQYSALTFIIDRGNGYILRANLWPRYVTPDRNTLTYAYDIPHNHNFDLLTVGYLGTGYETEIYELEDGAVIGYPGESVELTFLERTKLPKGKVMFYRRFKDVHVQLPPSELSVSLNLLFTDEEVNGRDQYSFDVDQKKIIGSLSGRRSEHLVVFEFAKLLGDETTGDILLSLAKGEEDPRARLAAYRCASHLIGNEATWKLALLDKSQDIRRAASLALTR